MFHFIYFFTFKEEVSPNEIDSLSGNNNNKNKSNFIELQYVYAP